MKNLNYGWSLDGFSHSMEMVFVEGTRGRPFLFGDRKRIEIAPYFMAATPVTQALWIHVMGEGSNPSRFRGDLKPVENVSWHDAHAFLYRINASGILAEMAGGTSGFAAESFRLPSESEWEYAAKGGPHWADAFQFSGSNDIGAVAWYDKNSGEERNPAFWENRPRSNHSLATEIHEVGTKFPNQLGLYDMSGNVWEWCQDCSTGEISRIPADGSPFTDGSGERILRGGCHHNWAIHCTVSKRYEIVAGHRDECVGFRLAMSGN